MLFSVASTYQKYLQKVLETIQVAPNIHKPGYIIIIWLVVYQPL